MSEILRLRMSRDHALFGSPLVVGKLLLVCPVSRCLIFGRFSTMSLLCLLMLLLFDIHSCFVVVVCLIVYTVVVIVLVLFMPVVLLDFPLTCLVSNSCYYFIIL
jgi:hypothetical protein